VENQPEPHRIARAIVRPPSATFAQGLTSSTHGKPDIALALEQHARYCAALEQCGLTLQRLAPDPDFPDSTFVEDTAIVLGDCAILTRPGAPSRQGEVARVAPVLRERFARVRAIEAPGTLDGGDVCHAGTHFFIGISERTNEDGARQLAALLREEGCTSAPIDMHGVPGILHLKSGMSWLGGRSLALLDTLIDRDEFAGWEVVRVPPHETYAANCIRINAHLLIAAGYPRFEAAVREHGHAIIALDMSEFRKMDGALTCLSLRY
jgi:dimethylargininase